MLPRFLIQFAFLGISLSAINVRSQEPAAPGMISVFYSSDAPVRHEEESRAEFAQRYQAYLDEKKLYAERPVRRIGETQTEFNERSSAFLRNLPDGVELLPEYVQRSMPDAKPKESQLLQVFQEIFPSFANVLANETRTAGDGWKISPQERQSIDTAINDLEETRQQLIQEAVKVESESDSQKLWKKVVASEREAEEKLCNILDEVFTPEEFDRFVQGHPKIKPVVVSSKIISNRLNIEEQDYLWMQDCKAAFMLSSFMFLKQNTEAPARKRLTPWQAELITYKHYGRLTPEQFLSAQRILGVAEPNESLEEFLERLPEKQYRLFRSCVGQLPDRDRPK